MFFLAWLSYWSSALPLCLIVRVILLSLVDQSSSYNQTTVLLIFRATLSISIEKSIITVAPGFEEDVEAVFDKPSTQPESSRVSSDLTSATALSMSGGGSEGVEDLTFSKLMQNLKPIKNLGSPVYSTRSDLKRSRRLKAPALSDVVIGGSPMKSLEVNQRSQKFGSESRIFEFSARPWRQFWVTHGAVSLDEAVGV